MILNIANEWGGKQGAQPNWRDAYITYGKKLREAGIANEIMIDTGGWGQDPTNVKLYGKQVADEIDKAARAKAAQLRTEANRMTNPHRSKLLSRTQTNLPPLRCRTQSTCINTGVTVDIDMIQLAMIMANGTSRPKFRT